MWAVLCILGGLSIWAGLHSFTTYPCSLWLLRKLRVGRTRPRPAASVPPVELAICVCAYNEAQVIGAKLDNLLALKGRYPGIELLVYVDGSNDATAEILRPHAGHIRLHVAAERRGKTHGMNQLVSMTRKPIVLFTDANVTIDLDAPQRLMSHFSDPEVGCVCGHLTYTNADASITARSGSLYWRLEQYIKRLESDLGSTLAADGSLFAIRRELHRPPPPDIIDDMYVSMMIWCEGYRVVQVDDVAGFELGVTRAHEEFGRKIRIACQAFNVHRMLWRRVRALDGLSLYMYVSHKWLRWLTIYSLVLGFGLLECSLIAAGHASVAGAALVVSAACLWLGYRSRVGPLAQIWDVLCAFAATGWGVFRSLRGDRYQTWTPAASIRTQVGVDAPAADV